MPFSKEYIVTHTVYLTGLDQYMAVILPLEYTTRVTSSVSWQLITTVWILGISAAVPGAMQMISAGNVSPWFACRNIIVSISELQNTLESTLSTSSPSNVEAFSSADYLISPSTFSHQHLPSFIFSMILDFRSPYVSSSLIS